MKTPVTFWTAVGMFMPLVIFISAAILKDTISALVGIGLAIIGVGWLIREAIDGGER